MKTLVILLSLMLAAPAQAATTVPAPQNTVTSSKQTIDQKKITARKAVVDKKLSTARKASLDKSSVKKQAVGTVTFKSSMHCENCVKKLTDNLAYSKGVKDLDISLEKNKITVTYDAAKTSEETLAGIIRKLGYEAVCEQPGK